jgi:hypothetical protein
MASIFASVFGVAEEMRVVKKNGLSFKDTNKVVALESSILETFLYNYEVEVGYDIVYNYSNALSYLTDYIYNEYKTNDYLNGQDKIPMLEDARDAIIFVHNNFIKASEEE